MTRFDEVARLKGLEKKAKPPKIGERLPGISSVMREALPHAVIVDTYKSISVFGEDIAAFGSHDDANHYIALRNAAPWLLEAAACFQPGDAERIARIAKDDLLEGCCSQCDADVDMMHRMRKAAEIMEGKE